MKIRGWLPPVAAAAIVVLAAWIVFARFFASSDPDPVLPAAVEPAPGVRGLFVLPEDGRAPVINELASAHESIDVMIYLLTDDHIIDALVTAEQRNVRVRVILEQHPFGGFGNPEEQIAQLRAGGVEVKWGRRAFPFTHAKLFVVDRAVAVITNANATPSSFTENREFGIVTTYKPDVDQAGSIFDADWKDADRELPGPLVVSPTTSRSAITSLIEGARHTLDIYAEVIRDDRMVDALVSAARRGVIVRIVTSPDTDARAQPIFQRLTQGGVELHILSSPYIHAKAIVADGQSLFVGSQNFTATSLDENREIGLVFQDPTAISRVRSTFEADYSAAIPWS